jgi:membrane fusion protein (multidrug efflux system)
VLVATVAEETVSPVLEIVGTSAPNRTSSVTAEVAGHVQAIHFSKGSLVEKGAPLAELDKTNEILGLEAVQSALAGVEISLDEARKDLERSNSLRKTNTISVQNYEKDIFKVRLLEQTLAGSKAEVARLEDKIQRMTIAAPFTGYITEQHTEVGEWLNPGTPVATIVDLSTIKIMGSLPERYLTQIGNGDRATVVFDALPNRSFDGQITAVIPSAEEKSRNLPIEITLDNPDGEIKAGLLSRVTLRGIPRKLLLVPKDALVLDRGKSTLFVVREQIAVPVEVTVGLAHDGQVEVFGQVKPGDQVVVQGNERLRPNQPVQVITSTEKADHPSVQ